MTQMSNDSYGDGNVYRGQRSKDSVVKTITLAQPEPVMHTLNCVCGAVWDIKTDGGEEMVHTPYTTPPQPEQKMTYQQAAQLINEMKSQPEQEPVAWLHVMDNTEGLKANGTGIVLITQKRKHPFGKPGIDFSKSYPVTSTPLYTAPPQRKPLTDEQIGTIALESQWGFSPHDDTLRFARAVEAAHGIKE